MLTKILRTAGGLVLWFALATIIAETIIASYLAWRWKIDLGRLKEIIRAAKGEKIAAETPAPPSTEMLLKEDPSYEEFLSRRAQKARDLEMREMQLRAAEEILQAQLTKLVSEKAKLAQMQKELDQKLAQVQDEAKAAARETVRGILESLRPDQAKAQLQAMTDRGEWDEAVAILTAMPASRRARILGEFKSPQDQTVLGELLKRIRDAGASAGQASAGSASPQSSTGT
ncbi:MAG: hypothetical protein NZ899_00915 [Thermoguttaceae bacterium]|nr:hypothetical protein [Thermoguttaceae bacterium]